MQHVLHHICKFLALQLMCKNHIFELLVSHWLHSTPNVKWKIQYELDFTFRAHPFIYFFIIALIEIILSLVTCWTLIPQIIQMDTRWNLSKNYWKVLKISIRYVTFIFEDWSNFSMHFIIIIILLLLLILLCTYKFYIQFSTCNFGTIFYIKYAIIYILFYVISENFIVYMIFFFNSSSMHLLFAYVINV